MSPAQQHAGDTAGPRPQKRRRTDRGRTRSVSPPDVPLNGAADEDDEDATGRRRRAPIACRVCRARKVKCSNERPTCAGCARLGCECVYPKPPRYGADSPEQVSPQVTQLLQEILKRLPSTVPSDLDQQAITPQASLGRSAGIAEPITYDTSGRSFSTQRCPSPNPGDSVVGVSPAFTSLDHMFQWPLLSVSGGDQFMPGNILAADHLQAPPQAGSPSAGVPLLDGEEITALLTRFLRLVHVMNPVLDCTTLMTYGRAVAELGPQWDAKTCLLLAAALGAIARPFGPGAETPSSLGSSASQQEDTQARKKAESYYQYAKRRFGVLGRSLTACQCHFLSGTYLLYTLRPVEAWQSFFQASSLYTVYLKSRAAAQMIGDGHCYEDEMVGDAHCSDEELRCCLEQRLFWSCIKSESEICAEVELPRSGLHNIDYPYQFPSPPTPKSVDGLNDTDQASMPGSSSATANSSPAGVAETQDFKELHEHSWFYYLSEISLLRLSSRVNHAFYVEPPPSWGKMNLLNMMNAAWDFEAQLRQWQASLPHAICCFDVPRGDTLASVTRLQLATWSRCASIKLHLYRPFLYRFALMQEQDWPLRDALRQLAERAVLLSLDPLFSVGLRHRHAGAWFKCRETAARALVVLCARRIGLLEEMGCAERAGEVLDLCMAHLRYWEGEAGDVRLARRTLEAMC
ncbi:hypothetical protein PLIIFM63780_006600 [Purpureocillium lilacinum]|nr:hypothetical protein PLIIFM63780_006600 [Purpureocillium lilacinum]